MIEEKEKGIDGRRVKLVLQCVLMERLNEERGALRGKMADRRDSCCSARGGRKGKVLVGGPGRSARKEGGEGGVGRGAYWA